MYLTVYANDIFYFLSCRLPTLQSEYIIHIDANSHKVIYFVLNDPLLTAPLKILVIGYLLIQILTLSIKDKFK